MRFEFDPAKNAKLLQERGVRFEDAIAALEKGCYILKDNKKEKYQGQELVHFLHCNKMKDDIPYIFTCVIKNMGNDRIRLITVYPDSVNNRKYREVLL